MSSPMGKYSLAAIALGIVAIILSSVATGLVLVQPAKPAPTTRDFFLVAGEWKTTLSNTTLPAGSMLTNGTVLTQDWVISGPTKVDVERYRWDPVALVVNKGDTVKVTVHVVNGRDHTFIISGSGDVIEPEDGIAAIGSGGAYASAAAKMLMKHTDLDARSIVKESLAVAAEICIYTNDNISVEELS